MRWRQELRRWRFAVLEHVVLPVVAVPWRWWIRSWRLEPPDAAAVAAMLDAPRALIVTFHGLLPHVLAFRDLAARRGRRFVVMLSPSLDGRLLAAMLGRLGVDHIVATAGHRGVAGSRALIERLGQGDIGIVAADGPLGPCFVVKPGPLRLATAAEAHVVIALAAARRSISLGSWDRARLPLPFTCVAASVRVIAPPVGVDAASVARLEVEMKGELARLERVVAVRK